MIAFEVHVICDCCEAMFSRHADQPDKGAALVAALNAGWSIRSEKIFCPKCANKSSTQIINENRN